MHDAFIRQCEVVHRHRFAGSSGGSSLTLSSCITLRTRLLDRMKQDAFVANVAAQEGAQEACTAIRLAGALVERLR
jgi:hypothetical protein